MIVSRRSLLFSAAPAFALANSAKVFRYAEVEAKIAKKDFRGITKDDLPTPCLTVERSLFEKNLKAMADYCKSTGINLRAHCKIHKSTDVTRKQIALGSLGVCCATIAESELMVNAGIKNVLHTCQPAGKNKIWRAAVLAQREPTFMCVADDPITVDLLDSAAEALKIKMTVLPDIYAGLTRHGHAPGDPGLKLAQKIDSSKNLKLGGIMGYSGGASHTKGWEARKAKSEKDVVPMVETAKLLKKSGLNVPIITGGSTGTYNIDKAIGLTELQAGSYIFMDTAYMNIGSREGTERYSDFDVSLNVLTTVISANHPNQVTIDAGNKALLRPTGRVKNRPEVIVENQGAEYGILKWNDGNGFKLGEKAELITTNLDMTTNCYDRYYVCEGQNVVDVWPIMGRAGALQR
ncbi:MAG: alanine racemase [Acidobacteria bacterium]|nr:alanine racemase [Acidobacteriota bacterium]